MGLPLLIIPPGGIHVVASLTLPPHAFAPYETAWALGAKLAALNALSAFEVAARMGLSPSHARPLVPPRTPRAALTLGHGMALPSWQIEQAFLGGDLQCLHPLLSNYLRMCPICARLGRHFIVHQVRALTTCPLHHVPLREHCRRCAAHLIYDLGASKIHGPITCPGCATSLLPVTRAGSPNTSEMPAGSFGVMARWLAFLRRRATQPAWRGGGVLMDTGRHASSEPVHEPMLAIAPTGSARYSLDTPRTRWIANAEYRELEQCYWRHANAHWRQCAPPSRRWYRCLLKGDVSQTAPDTRILAFVYWRMTWQGCSNPYLLRRGHGLPLYGVAEWQACQPAPDDDDLDAEIHAFSAALDSSWNEWLDCIDLLGVTKLIGSVWRVRAIPGAYVSLPRKQRKRASINFA